MSSIELLQIEDILILNIRSGPNAERQHISASRQVSSVRVSSTGQRAVQLVGSNRTKHVAIYRCHLTCEIFLMMYKLITYAYTRADDHLRTHVNNFRSGAADLF